MGKFISPPVLTPRGDGRTWRVDAPLIYVTAAGAPVRVPVGFISDLASVPRIFWSVLPPFGRYTAAAVLHDWMYRTHHFRRAMCDAIFLESMTSERVATWQRITLYLAVRLCGWIAWRDERRWKKHLVML